MPEARTQDDLAFLRRVLPPPPARVLDVACGLGRHVRGLAEAGYECVGVELDDELAAEARRAGLDVRTLDMRELERVEGTFDAVLSMWSSFGLFDDATNAAVLAGMVARLRPRGTLVLELPNRGFFEPRQGPWEVRPGIRERKWVRDGRLHAAHDDGARFEWQLYEPEELAALTGLAPVLVERSPDDPRLRIALQESAASSGASAAAPSTSEATIR